MRKNKQTSWKSLWNLCFRLFTAFLIPRSWISKYLNKGSQRSRIFTNEQSVNNQKRLVDDCDEVVSSEDTDCWNAKKITESVMGPSVHKVFFWDSGRRHAKPFLKRLQEMFCFHVTCFENGQDLSARDVWPPFTLVVSPTELRLNCLYWLNRLVCSNRLFPFHKNAGLFIYF